MADITPYQNYVVKLSDREWRLIAKALAYMSGVTQIKPNGKDKLAAYELNEMLLKQRRSLLEQQLQTADAALKRALETPKPEAEEGEQNDD